jgi:asparagine synthase (glutamine-hydrolysing)
MTDVKLTYNLVHHWHSKNNISVIGNTFLDKILLKENTLIKYFEEVDTEISFADKLKNTVGHFAVVLETQDYFFIAVDIIRTIPLFIRKDKNGILITDTVECSGDWNSVEVENLKKTYCTLENNTLLSDWQQLQSGEYAVIDKINLSIEINSYYRHQKNKEENEDEKTRCKRSEKKMMEKVIAYANNRTILLPLSGGYDSRYLLALLKENNYPSIECFTYGRKESHEVLIARNVCEKLNVKWHYIEYTDELLQLFFNSEWNKYSKLNHHFSSLPHEQDFFALHYLQQNNLLAENAVVMNGFCQDIHAGSFIEPIRNFDLQKFIYHKYQLKLNALSYENTWNGYREWLIKNRLSKFIINSVRVYEFFGLDFYLPFWNTDWINFWYSLPDDQLLNQQFYRDYLFSGIFKRYKIDFKKPSHEGIHKLYTLKKISKAILPPKITKLLQLQNSKDISKDANNTLFLYEEIYKRLKEKPTEKDFRINNIHALYFLEKLKENHQL